MNGKGQSVEAGYFIDEQVLLEVECEQLLDAIAVSPSIRRGRAGSRHLMSHPEVRRIASDPRMLRIAHRALGTKAVPYRATLFEKSERRQLVGRLASGQYAATGCPRLICLAGDHGLERRVFSTRTRRHGHFPTSLH
jgi:hypothetical protein